MGTNTVARGGGQGNVNQLVVYEWEQKQWWQGQGKVNHTLKSGVKVLNTFITPIP